MTAVRILTPTEADVARDVARHEFMTTLDQAETAAHMRADATAEAAARTAAAVDRARAEAGRWWGAA